MPNYLCIQRSEPSPATEQKPKPQMCASEMEEMYAQFTAWKDRFAANIVDMGGKLGDGKLVTSEGALDGPFVEAKELLGGYMIVSADSLEEAIEVASGVPGITKGRSGVWVREIHTS